MPGFIRNANDERRWELAKDLGRKRAEERLTDKSLAPISNIWAYINWLYQNVIKENETITELDENIDEINSFQGMVLSETDNELYDVLKNYSKFKHKSLKEDELYNKIEEYYTNYKQVNGNNIQRQKILEFVNTYGSRVTSFGTSGPYNVMGGFRDEAPKGPYVFGVKDTDKVGAVGQTQIGPRDKNIIVPVDDTTKSDYQPPTDLDNQGNSTADQQNINNKQKLQSELDGTFGDILEYIIDNTGMSLDDIQDLDEDDLENLIKKLVKRSETNVLSESLITEVDKKSPIQLARNILTLKHQQRKATQKDGRRYVLNQNAIISLMGKYGYKFNKKYNKWVKKRSLTYDARRILFDKYQEKDAFTKNKEGEYLLTQDDVRKMMHSHNYFYNLEKKQWEQRFEVEKDEDSDKKETKSVTTPTPPQNTSNTNKSIKQSKPVLNQNSDEVYQSKKKDDKPKEKEKDDDKEDIVINPLNTSEVKDKMKLLQARFILGIIEKNKSITEFEKVEENGVKTYVPSISDEQVLSMAAEHYFEWNPEILLWIDKGTPGFIDEQLRPIGESSKTVIARSYLASLDKFKNIKLNDEFKPVVPNDELDDEMEKEDFYFDEAINKWKYVGESTKDDELDESLKEPIHHEIVDPESFSTVIMNEAIDYKKNYNMVDVSDAQAKLLYRALQLNYIASINDQAEKQEKYNKVQTGGEKDPTSNNSKLTQKFIDDSLEKLKYSFNNDKNKPMWVYNNKIPSVLTNLGIDEKSYIARGILGSKDNKFIQFDSSDINKVDLAISNNKVSSYISHDNVWSDDYGWVKSTDKEIKSKDELQHGAFLDSVKDVVYDDMSKADQDKLKSIKSFKIANYLFNNKYGTNKEWKDLSISEKAKATKQLKLNYTFDKNKKEWVKNKKTVSSKLLKTFGNVLGGLKNIGIGVAKGLGKFAKLISTFKVS